MKQQSLSESLTEIQNNLNQQLPTEIANELKFQNQYPYLTLDYCLQICYKPTTPPTSVQSLYSESMLRLDRRVAAEHPQWIKLIDQINGRIHCYFESQQQVMMNLMAMEKDGRESLSQTTVPQQPSQPMEEEPSTIKIISEEKLCEEKEMGIDEIKKKYAKNLYPTQQDWKGEHCICQSQTNFSDSGLIIQCKLCSHFSHISCLGVGGKEFNYKNFVCPKCVLLHYDPFTPVSKVVIAANRFQNAGSINHKTFTFTTDKQIVEIRCVRMDSRQSSEEITWPDMGELFMNGKKIAEFKPLPQNSCLKKRKDDKLMISDLQTTNCLQIKENIPYADQREKYRIQTGCTYFVGVYNVEQYTSRQLINNVLQNGENWMSVEQAQDYIQLYLASTKNEDIAIDSLTVSLQCSINLQLMQTPARGNLCNHVQCFCLENLCAMLEWMKPRKWRCVICKQKIYKLQIDAFQLAIVNSIKRMNSPITEVTFDSMAKISNSALAQIIQYDSIPAYGLQNNNRIIQLEQLCSKQQLIYRKDQPQVVVNDNKSQIQKSQGVGFAKTVQQQNLMNFTNARKFTPLDKSLQRGQQPMRKQMSGINASQSIIIE